MNLCSVDVLTPGLEKYMCALLDINKGLRTLYPLPFNITRPSIMLVRGCPYCDVTLYTSKFDFYINYGMEFKNLFSVCFSL